MSIFVFVSFSAVNGIAFSLAFSFTAENEMLFGRPLVYMYVLYIVCLGLEINVLVLKKV